MWPVARRLLAMLMGSIYGLMLGALLGAAGTFWVYGIGSWVGAPTGLVLGGMRGWNMSLRDATILFAGCFDLMIVINWSANTAGWGSLEAGIATFLGGLLGGATLLAVAHSCLAPETRRRLAIGLGVPLGIWMLHHVYMSLYVWE